MEMEWTVAEGSQLSVVLPGESFLLEMLVLTVECKAGFLTTPGTEGGRAGEEPESTLLRGRRERPRPRLGVDTVRSPSVLGFAGNRLRQQEQQSREEEQVFQKPSSEGRERVCVGGEVTGIKPSLVHA